VHKKTDTSITDERFNYYKERFVERWWEANPTAALFNGYHKYDSLLQVPSPQLLSRQTETFKGMLDSLHSFTIGELSTNNKIDYRIIENQLLSAIWYINEFRSWEWNPSEYNVGGEFAQIISETYDKLDKRLRTLSWRLANVPAYYKAARENIKNPTIEHTELAIQQNRGALSVFEQMLQDSLKRSGLSIDEKTALLVKADAAKNAILDYLTWLEKDLRPSLKPAAARSFRIGKELYDKKFALDIVSDYSAEQIYRKALQRKDEIHAEMEKISRMLWPRYFAGKPIPSDRLDLIKSMIDTLSRRHVHRDSFISAIKKQIPDLVKFINDNKLIYLDPKKPLVVRETPAYMQGVAGASISAPGPYEKDANTYYNVTPLNHYTPERAESYLREYNHYILQILNIHEAIPGHYTQLVYSN
jgi:uncharacterized protein (DUF885 family)